MKIALQTLVLISMIFAVGSCGPQQKMDDENFSNGVAGASYFYNDKFVHEKNYGQELDGYYREGIVACAYSKKFDKFSVDMFVPSEQEVGSFANAAEGVFLELYDRGGIPGSGDYQIGPNVKSTVSGVLPPEIIPEVHHFSTNLLKSTCLIRIANTPAKFSGSIDCTDLGSTEVSGRLTVRSQFECKSIEEE